MTADEKQKLVWLLEFLGWRDFEEFGGQIYGVNLALSTNNKLLLPPLTLDLMHEAEGKITEDNSLTGKVRYRNLLMHICGTHAISVHATKEQRLDALLMTIGKL